MKMFLQCVVVCVSLLLTASSAFANGIVTNVTMRQIVPWPGLVEISYELTEDVPERNGYDRSTKVTVTDRTTGQVYEPKSFTRPFTYDQGTKKMVWDAHADGVRLMSLDVGCVVSVEINLLKCRYVVIDLSEGTSASLYPMKGMEGLPSSGWTDEYKTTKIVLRRIEPGSFRMNNSYGVTLTMPYYIGVFEVTQRQWELVMGTRTSYFSNNSYYATRPVEQVSYDMIRGSSAGAQWPTGNKVDLNSFLGKLRTKTGLEFDLPTEAQWEYACRAGTATDYNNGRNNTGSSCTNMNQVGRYWHNGGSSYSSSCNVSAGTAKVGSYQPNAWGLYDMHGNVSEWCLDWYGNLSGETDPGGSRSGSSRVLRGGWWGWNAYYCDASSRRQGDPSTGNWADGFRLSCILQEKDPH